MMGPGEEDARIDPADIGKAFVYVAEQGKNCWTQGVFLVALEVEESSTDRSGNRARLEAFRGEILRHAEGGAWFWMYILGI